MYVFKWHAPQHRDEDLDHVPDFKAVIDGFVDNAKTVLSIGWRKDTRCWELYAPLSQQADVTVVEIFQPNVNDFNAENPNPKTMRAVCADIRKFIKTTDQKFDVCTWQDGPEHITLAEFAEFLNDSEKKIGTIIIACPNGHFPQGSIGGNDAEEHISTWTPEVMNGFGFNHVTYQAGPTDKHIRIHGLIGYRKNPLYL